MAREARRRKLLRTRLLGAPGVAGPRTRGVPALALLVGVPLLVLAVVSGTVWDATPGQAVSRGRSAVNNPGVVRIFTSGGAVQGSGILVDRNWVLTTGHTFTADLSQYTFRFGGTDNSQDANDQANLRKFDRMAVHPTVPDLVMVHVETPVPADATIMSVATTNPFTPSSNRAVVWGWGNPGGGTQLRLALTAISDQDPVANLAARRSEAPDVWSLVGDARMLALNEYVTRAGDSGGPLMRDGAAAGMNFGRGLYRVPNATGTLNGPEYRTSYEIALWPYAQWIQQVINGEGSSSSNPAPHDELKRRKLEDDTDSQAVMTGPTPCPGDGSCNPSPAAPLATLVASSAHNGSVVAKCAGSDDGDSCSFESTSYSKASTPALQLAPPPKTGIDATTGRLKIIVWCKLTGSLTTGAPPGDLVRFSFTNTDVTGVNPAYGWWDVPPQQVEGSPDNPLSGADLTRLSTCPS